jgi:hypothetical protein
MVKSCVFFAVRFELLNIIQMSFSFKPIPALDQTENPHDVLTTVKTAEEDYGNIRITCTLLYYVVLLHQMYCNLSIKPMALKLGKPRELPYYIDGRTAG